MDHPSDTVVPVPAAPTAKVMLVDDSAVIRGLMQRILAAEPAIEIVASASNGQSAIRHLTSRDIQIVILDIEMPIMDGLSALPKLLDIDPDLKVIVASTLTQRNAEISLRALELGATDYIPKPTSPREIGVDGSFHRELLAKIRSLAARPRLRPRRVPATEDRTPATPARTPPSPPVKRPIVLRTAPITRPSVIAIGSSTGGPQALFSLLRALPQNVDLPILITQHMPRMFTAILAQHIGRNCGRPCREAADNDLVRPGQIYLAPGDHHMVAEARGGQLFLRLNQDPPENFCRPAVDPMLRSLAKAVGPKVLTIILTGMGNDGLAGARLVTAAGGAVLAQDEASSVVWGMPGAVANAGLCSAVLPLSELAGHISQIVTKAAP